MRRGETEEGLAGNKEQCLWEQETCLGRQRDVWMRNSLLVIGWNGGGGGEGCLNEGR